MEKVESIWAILKHHNICTIGKTTDMIICLREWFLYNPYLYIISVVSYTLQLSYEGILPGT